ncbi:MAG: hypothetical protein OXT74_05300 [Candidatus Poribacteria bacterium]|nr:hypothetical protein [Candidatus Poribacteria bacterium]
MRLEVGIIALVAEVLGVPADRGAQFDWLRNKPTAEHFGDFYPNILHLFEGLGGDKDGLFGKADGYLTPDAYFPEPYNFIFEFDELQHFTAPRQKSLTLYPAEVPLAFDREQYLRFCAEHHESALRKGTDRFRRKTADFPFVNGRAAQRAFFDTFRDWLPPLHGLRPTLRIAEFEVAGILGGELSGKAARECVAGLLEQRLEMDFEPVDSN